MKKRTLSLILAALMLVSVGCGSSGASDETTTAASVDTTTAEPVAKEPFESCDYKGESFKILAPDQGEYKTYYFAEEQNGEPMNDAIYERNAKIEEYLGIDITHVCTGAITEIHGKVQQSVMADDNEYQLVLTHGIGSVANLVRDGLLYDWNDLEYVNLDADYWNQSCNENLKIGGKQYYAASDFMLPSPYLMLFNKDMITDFKLENPYELVRANKWTIDKLAEMADAVTSDIDGNTVMDKNDRFGLGNCGDSSRWSPFMYSAGMLILERTDDGFKLDINNDTMLSLVDKLDTLVNKSGNVYNETNIGHVEGLSMNKNRVLFELSSSGGLKNYRDTDVDFGILPYPLLDEKQEKYETVNWGGMMCVPRTVSNPEMVGKAAELLSFYSGDSTSKVYRELVLGEKLSRDADSKEMLDIIFDNIVYDAGLNYFGFSKNLGNYLYMIPRMIVDQKSADFASWYTTYETGALGEIEALMTAIFENS